MFSKQTTTKERSQESRRQQIVTYLLKLPNGNIVQVCKELFLSTFDLGEWTVLNWISDNRMTPCKEVVVKRRRQSNQRKQTRNVEGKEILENFLYSLPKLPSHYCRKEE